MSALKRRKMKTEVVEITWHGTRVSSGENVLVNKK
jgi:hypothetical protein